ncbi:protein SpAN-like [Macrobrachium nipponense]|uniref:protein SpAN-like n=1 Tax=Macrobrachium nipponense TaxID=159736 RepID=UPI0030C7E440
MPNAFLPYAVLVASAPAASVKDGDISLLNPTAVNGTNLYETDILLTDGQHLQVIAKKAINYLAARWSTDAKGFPEVPYSFGDERDKAAAVAAGIDHWEENTCITFHTSPHIKFILGSGCWSYIGSINSNTGQDLSIGTGCTGVGTVAHEIGHAIGFYHEQSRSDRDRQVKILLENVIAGKESNFNSYADNNYSVPYDFLSDMHYNSEAFSSNGKLTIVTVDPMNQELIGVRDALSHMDKLLANKIYPCIDVRCTKVIEAPACHKVQLNFTDFQIYGRHAFCNNTMCCYFEILEIRTNDSFKGDV